MHGFLLTVGGKDSIITFLSADFQRMLLPSLLIHVNHNYFSDEGAGSKIFNGFSSSQ